jgi:hypothetical protein
VSGQEELSERCFGVDLGTVSAAIQVVACDAVALPLEKAAGSRSPGNDAREGS